MTINILEQVFGYTVVNNHSLYQTGRSSTTSKSRSNQAIRFLFPFSPPRLTSAAISAPSARLAPFPVYRSTPPRDRCSKKKGSAFACFAPRPGRHGARRQAAAARHGRGGVRLRVQEVNRRDRAAYSEAMQIAGRQAEQQESKARARALAAASSSRAPRASRSSLDAKNEFFFLLRLLVPPQSAVPLFLVLLFLSLSLSLSISISVASRLGPRAARAGRGVVQLTGAQLHLAAIRRNSLIPFAEFFFLFFPHSMCVDLGARG